ASDGPREIETTIGLISCYIAPYALYFPIRGVFAPVILDVMTGSNGKHLDTAAVQKLYSINPTARAALDHFAQRKNNSTRTTVDRLQAALRAEGHDIGRGEILEFLKALATAGCGVFVIGRKGHPSRFEWSVNLVDLGRSGSGESIKVQAITPATTPARAVKADDDDALVEHRYHLRSDIELRFDLPSNLTAVEANRIADFIKTLPFS
ncbi:MAG: hypothetical protein ACR2OU_17940, partial [Thermomicrobiales bacterium]